MVELSPKRRRRIGNMEEIWEIRMGNMGNRTRSSRLQQSVRHSMARCAPVENDPERDWHPNNTVDPKLAKQPAGVCYVRECQQPEASNEAMRPPRLSHQSTTLHNVYRRHHR